MKLSKQENENKISKIIASKEQKIYNWVKTRLESIEDAEDVAQDILKQILISLRKKYVNNEEINNVDSYVMAIASNVLNDYYRKKPRYTQDTFIQKANKSKGLTREVVLMLRDHIVHLNYKQRETMMMFYIDQIPIKQIAEKLNTTEAYVKHILYKCRDILKKKVKEIKDDFPYNYHPDFLKMTFSGEIFFNSDLKSISECLSKQHICITCYQQPCTIEKIGEITKIPKAIIEYDLEWLVDKGFIRKKKNSYFTNFVIVDSEIKVLLMNIYMKNKKDFSDSIIEKLIAYEGKIRNIGFLGSDIPMEKLLWFLVYTFADITTFYFFNKNNDYNFDIPARLDGGHYIPIGFHRIKPKTKLSSNYIDKYDHLYDWISDGTYIYNHNGCAIKWLGIKNRSNTFSKKVIFNNIIPDVIKYKNILFKSLKADFNIDDLSQEERLQFDTIITEKWISFSEKENKINPNFPVFTPEQKKQLIEIFIDIYEQLKPAFNNIYLDLRKMCKQTLPLHLHNYLDYSIYLSLLINHTFAIGYAYYDGKIYKPKTNVEWTLLTLSMLITEDIQIDNDKNFYILLSANYI